ncbi:SEC-C domain-containing protein [Pseudomonas aeruginosa]|nr:SEC-C domain-containing protein [Pseudomonas aeruginosa]
MPFSAPTHLSNPLRRFARRLVPDAAPEVAAPLPMPESLAGEPWVSVGRAVEALGGERVDGWILEEWRGLALRARFSACWRDPRGNLWNVLPQAGAIAFLADPQRRYEGVPLADQYQALSRDVLLEDYLGLRRQLARAGLDDEARERLAGMAARLESWLALGGRGDQACPCGSGKRYRNCCSRLVAPAS